MVEVHWKGAQLQNLLHEVLGILLRQVMGVYRYRQKLGRNIDGAEFVFTDEIGSVFNVCFNELLLHI